MHIGPRECEIEDRSLGLTIRTWLREINDKQYWFTRTESATDVLICAETSEAENTHVLYYEKGSYGNR